MCFDILPLAPQSAETLEDWTAVRLPAAKTGFIASRYVRRPIACRVSFAKRDGQGLMAMFLAGD